MKYVTKVMDSIGGGGEGGDAKVYGYWLFGKRFNSYSPSLLKRKENE
ncbi:hypothetical protein [Saccharolobus shibatae]|uniref:Uncharacterized protein n=1 Tax=Saccharolobus shibatae TaxID=2286 RepID=A0A8F5BZF1_9CREN|nr:hypothetical protein [Saccharolobus shibatae]QXJ34175.1 hypothetical protein J5U22_00721 [Saccharolobus shibatae]